MNAMRRRSFMVGAASSLFTGGATAAEPTKAGDLVILIPGITGSVLSVDGRPIWSPSVSGIVSALFSLGENLRLLALKHDEAERDVLDDGVVATSLVEDIHLIPGLWKIDGYTRIVEHLTALPGLQRGDNLQMFPYDWRRDNRVSARRLKSQAREWLDAWRLKSGNDEARLVILAHSMGGLVARYYIECLEGWKITRSLVTFGTPYRGAPVALRALTQGLNISGVNLSEVSKLLRSFTSIYQLLPTYACIEQNGTLMRVQEVANLPNVDADRVRKARSFHEEMNSAARRNREHPDFMAAGYVCLPVVGVRQETVQMAHQTGRTLTFSTNDHRQQLHGDGTVPRPSATPLELEQDQRDFFINEAHGSLQNSKRVLSQISDFLASTSSSWTSFRTTWPNEPSGTVSLRLGSDGVPAGASLAFLGRVDTRYFLPTVEIEVADAYSDRVVWRDGLTSADSGQFSGRIPASAIPVGAYRARARFARRTQVALETVSDVFCVLPT